MNNLMAAVASRDKSRVEEIIRILKGRGQDTSGWEKMLKGINHDLEG